MSDIIQRGESGDTEDGTVKKRSRVQDLWDDSPLSDIVNSPSPTEKVTKSRLKSKPLEAYLPERLATFLRWGQWAVIVLTEVVLIAALIGASQMAGLFYGFGFDALRVDHWQALLTYYESGQAIPWEFVGALAGPPLLLLILAIRVVMLNADPDNESANRIRAAFAWPFKVMSWPFRALLRQALKKPQRSLRRSQSKRRSKKKDHSDAPDSEDMPLKFEAGGGSSSEHTSYQSEPMDPSLVSLQQGRGSNQHSP